VVKKTEAAFDIQQKTGVFVRTAFD